MTHIIALGGGGLSEETDYALERYILTHARTTSPQILFLPQASAEDPGYVARFHEAFAALGVRPSWLSLFGRVPQSYAERIQRADVIYVGGGNTRSMLALWQEWRLVPLLTEALANGTILCGVSAGAICWFEQCLTDSLWPMVPLDGLGMLRGSCCPHYNGEPERRPLYTGMVARGEIAEGLALEDGVAAHFRDGRLESIVTARSEARAYRVTRDDAGDAIETPLETIHIG